MLLTYLMLGVALCLSAIAAFYSIVGLMAIFAAAAIPIAVMGSILEIAKLTVTVWLHEYWKLVKRSMKLYLVPAVAVLMLITSMGIFGFLSKAHLDQAVPTGDVAAKVSLIDEKIKTERDNIEAARKALRQMDEAVDQTMARSNDEKGADKAAQLRRSQARERGVLQNDIATAQKKIAALNEERAPIASELRKVEAEVGPVKYIAALIYGDNPDANLLEKAVRWVIIILVLVFDPLAVMMLLAATESMKWEQQARLDRQKEKDDDTDVDDGSITPKDLDGQSSGNDADVQPPSEVVPIPDKQWGGQDLTARLETAIEPPPVKNGETVYVNMPNIVQEPNVEHQYVSDAEDEVQDPDAAEKEAKRRWKLENPDDTIHRHEALLESGKISQLPWQEQLKPQADDLSDFVNVDFGTQFPPSPSKGDAYIRVDYLPTKLFKFNGIKWIEVDKNTTDTFAYNDNYIDHLIAKIGTGEYDPDLLNDNERQQIEQRLRNDNNLNG